ncbi:MAG: EAL domain-containing protein [Woeseiaceae bacterium]|nr:EAL domain-containing protein [Woeseiaceae bacterium]
MSLKVLKSLQREKYARLLPRIFSGAMMIELEDRRGEQVWRIGPDDGDWQPVAADDVADWTELTTGIEQQRVHSGQIRYRAPVVTRDSGPIGSLTVTYDAQSSVPLETAVAPLKRSFADAAAFLQDEIELQQECDQLAIELTERYEELNLVYSTQDQVDYIEEGQEALLRLVHNCADYLDVGLAVLICRDRGLVLHSANRSEAPSDAESLLNLLSKAVYDRVESQVACVIVNELDDDDRRRLLRGRSENVLAYPVLDDHGSAIGMLAVIARRDLHTFSNGDRNLLEVMAKKASRIIHTHHDSLTGLMNRNGFESSLVASLATARSSNVEHCLLHIDLDQLHVVNDLMGHQEGDALIRRVAKSLRGMLRDSDYLARLGGDEFAVLLTKCSMDQGQRVAEKIRSAVSELTVIAANRQLDVTASIGAVAIDRDSEGIVGAMAAAEIACKGAKDNGRDRIEIFEQDNTTLIRRSEEIEWIGRVQEALREDRFELYCQPVLPIDEDEAPHYEILVRMLDDDGGVLPPATFLPAAERYQLMPLIDRWVIHNTLHSLDALWGAIDASGAVFCINLSGQSLTNNGFMTFVIDELRQFGVAADRICFEITETAAISNIDEANRFIAEIRAIGCRFALDDFGAGLSSFGYLKVLDVDYLKIDGSFIRELTTDRISQSMVEAICQIGRTMGLSMIAEYVGDDATVELLRGIGVDYLQGYHIGKPVPLAHVTDKLRTDAAARSA